MKYLKNNPCFILVLILIFNIESSSAQSNDSISIPQGTAATIDGVISAGEWNDASVKSIPDGDFLYKHTSTHLYVAFTNTLYHNSTGIYIDKNHNGGSSPQTDDIWMHGSAGQYEFVGTGSSWQMVTPLDWAFIVGTSSEYMIPLTKLGIPSPGTYNFGILFCLRDWSINQTDEITWPAGGFPNCSNPDSWATATILLTNDITEHSKRNKEIKVFPNPASGIVNIDLGEFHSEVDIIVSNIVGQEILMKKFKISNKISFEIKGPAGLYLVEVRKASESKSARIKILKE